jgi:hypothetical protein
MRGATQGFRFFLRERDDEASYKVPDNDKRGKFAERDVYTPGSWTSV